MPRGTPAKVKKVTGTLSRVRTELTAAREKLGWQEIEIRKLTEAHRKLMIDNEALKHRHLEVEQLKVVVAQAGKLLNLSYGEL